jgi:hypothetical protein
LAGDKLSEQATSVARARTPAKAAFRGLNEATNRVERRM